MKAFLLGAALLVPLPLAAAPLGPCATDPGDWFGRAFCLSPKFVALASEYAEASDRIAAKSEWLGHEAAREGARLMARAAACSGKEDVRALSPEALECIIVAFYGARSKSQAVLEAMEGKAPDAARFRHEPVKVTLPDELALGLGISARAEGLSSDQTVTVTDTLVFRNERLINVERALVFEHADGTQREVRQSHLWDVRRAQGITFPDLITGDSPEGRGHAALSALILAELETQAPAGWGEPDGDLARGLDLPFLLLEGRKTGTIAGVLVPFVRMDRDAADRAEFHLRLDARALAPLLKPEFADLFEVQP